MEIVYSGPWTYYIGEGSEDLDDDKIGKWMFMFDDYGLAARLCEQAVEDGIVCEAKHNTYPDPRYDHGVCCFYMDGDDIESHESVISFFMDNDMIPRDASGRFEDIPFKYDWQTAAGQYGDDFVPEITLSDFIDLETGEWAM